jgi:hypothetical protein
MSAVIRELRPKNHYEYDDPPDSEIFTVAVGDAFDGIELYGIFSSIHAADLWAGTRFADYMIIEIVHQDDEELL